MTVVSADPIEATTSHLAAAVWFPTSAGPHKAVARWSDLTFTALMEEARAGRPGAFVRESMSLFRHPPEQQPWAAAVGDVRSARPDELPPGYRYGLRYAVPLVEMPLYLPDLLRRVISRNVDLTSRRVSHLGDLVDLSPDVVVNAAGLAAGGLVGDGTTYPVRGQIVRVANPGLALSVRDEEHPVGARSDSSSTRTSRRCP